MGSQTLEILRQGVWASLTGGWFYDPRLDVFSNTFHLYIWLFLLCLPFTIYLYFPPDLYVWIAYCSTIIVLFGTIKIINNTLHSVYDTTEYLEEPSQNVSQQKPESEKKRDSRLKRRDQSQEQDFLGKTDTPPVECSSRNSYIEQNVPNADADSITSDYTRDKPNSTIDLKVEIHRKNSSESSEEAAHLNKSVVTSKRVTNVHKAEMISKQDNDPDFRAKTNVKRNLSTSRKFCRYASEDASTARNRYPKSNMGKTGSESQIKQTSSMELEQPDDYEYWKYNQSVRRLNSTSIPMEMLNDHPQSLEIISIMAKKDDVEKDSIPSHPQSLEVISQMPHQSLAHPQSLEIIRAPSKMTNPTDDNNLPLYPQSLEMINSKKTLPQNTLKRNKLQLMPYLSCGSEIVHPIAEQSDEQIPSDNTGRYNEDSQPQDSLSPLLTHEEEERYLRYIVDTTVDNDSANSRDALLEAETKPSGSNNNRRFSNTSQSSWDLSDGERRKEKRRDRSKHRQQQQTSSQADDQTANSGSIVGIDWLFENGEGEPWTNKIMWTSQKSDDTDASDSIQTASTDYLPSKDPDSGSSSTTTLSIENEVKRKLLPQQEHSSQSADVDSKRQQGAIPKQNKSKLNVPVSPVEETCSITESKKQNPEDIIRNVTTKKRGRTQNRERRNRWLTSLHAANASNAHNASPKMSTSLVPLGSTNRNHENRSGNTSVMLYRPLTSGSNQDIDGLPPPPPPGVPLLAAIMSHSNYTQRLSGAVALPDPHHHHHHHYHHHHHTQQQQHQHQFQHPQIRLQQQQIQAREDLRAAHLNEVRGSRSQRYKRLHRANRARRNRPRSGQQQTQQSQPSQQQEEEYITLSHFFHHHWPPIPPDTSEESAIRYFCNDRGQWLAYTIDDNSQSAACGPALLAGCELPVGARILTSEQNDQLVNRMLNQNLNRNAYYDGNYELTEIPDLSKNSYSSLSLNSAGLTVIIDTPSTESPPALTSPIHSVTNIASNNSGSSHSNAGSSTIASKLPTSTNQSMHLNAPNGRGSPYRTITDSLTDRNRRLQNLLGNLDATHPGSSSTNVDAAGNLLQPMNNQPNTTSENLSWNRFVTEFIGFEEATQPKPKPARHYYKWKIWKLPEIRVHFDRLSLVALLDRNLTIFESIVATLLAVMVAGLALIVLQRGFYKDIFAFIFCFVTAGCQYSLLKSVQPDAASPTHGFNRIVVFSRPVYYIICTSIVLILESSIKNFEGSDFRVYGMQILNYDVLLQSRDVMLVFLLCFPLIFSFGLFPQINTFVMYLCEHIDIHIFGGNATTSLVSSIYCLFRSVLTVMTLYGFAYGALMEPKSSQHILFSIFCGLLVAVSYHLSRSSSDPSVIFDIIKTNLWPPEVYLEERQSQIIENASTRQEATAESSKLSKSKSNAKKKDVKINMGEQSSDSELFDPLPQKLRATVKARLKNDLIVCAVIGILSFAIHASTVFTALQPEINPVLWFFTGLLGLLLHYIMPQMRKQLPWLCLSKPVLRNHEFSQFEVREPVKIMWFEKIYVYLNFFERNILYPVVFLGSLTESSTKISKKFGPSLGALIIVICGLKALRSSYSDSSSRYLVLVFSALLFRYDLQEEYSETFLIDYFITAIIFSKMYELLLKIRFIVTYIAPWQITWGSAFHAFAQPFSVPHSAMLFLQAGISALLSTPLNPVLGSAIFISSYVRPVKFWERDYKTRRVDHSNTRMAQHLERNLGADDNNLNSIFYEQLTRSLQHSLYGDLALGRWGSVEQGDCFLLASDYLNCLVHIVQLGNGLATYQLRGLEFRGTYCQQREVEAISEGIEDNDNCCCCEMGHFSHVLSVNAAFSQRWLAWEVASSKYVLEGYSISDNSAGSMLQVFDFRKVLVSYYVKSIIFYAIKSPKLKQWLTDPEIVDPLKPTLDKSFVDLDPVFNMNIDEDFDYRASGITRSSFCNIYLDWIQFCANEQDKSLEKSRDSSLVSLCLSLSLLGRRVLGAASHNTVSSVEFFLYGLHALFKGDFRITSARDEWVLHDIDLLNTVVAKGVRMALKLHQDHFMSPDTYEEASALHEAIVSHDRNLVISHEADPLWRKAILSGAPSLLALRHVMDDGIDEYKVIMLNKRFLSFRVIKMNRECVRGLWAGQQQELIYLRNRNPERGSIQNAKQALRNIINSSCDQPIGYPIYVSPLTTSYAETNEQLCSVIGGPLSFSSIRNNIFKLWRRVRRRCGQGCSSGGTGSHDDGGFGNVGVYAMTTYNAHTGYGQPGQNASGSQSMESGCQIGGSTTGRSSLSRGNTSSVGGCRGSLASMGKPTSSTLASLAGLLSNTDVKVEAKSSETSFTTKVEKEEVFQRVRIMDPNHVYDAINLGRRIDVIWPDEKMRQMGGRSGWLNWVPERGMEGCVVHRWSPNHRDPNRRSHVDKVILLVRIDEKYVPIAEQGVRDLGAEV